MRSRMVVSVIAAASMVALVGCGSRVPSNTTSEPHSSASPSPSGADDFYSMVLEPRKDGHDYQPIYDLITSAKKTLDITMDRIDDTTVNTDLAADAARGVTVRVILGGETYRDSGGLEYLHQDEYDFLKEHQVLVVWASSAYPATDQNTITVDASTSAIMTGSLDDGGYSIGRNFAVLDTDKADVSAIETVFDADFAHTAVTPSDADHLVWSPTNSEARLLALINGATHTLRVEFNEISDDAITSALVAAAKRGVDVKLTLELVESEQSILKTLTPAGAHWTSHDPDESELDIHAGVIIADGSTMFVGSQNHTDSSWLTKNRELGFITTNARMISTISSAFATDYANTTPLGPPLP